MLSLKRSLPITSLLSQDDFSCRQICLALHRATGSQCFSGAAPLHPSPAFGGFAGFGDTMGNPQGFSLSSRFSVGCMAFEPHLCNPSHYYRHILDLQFWLCDHVCPSEESRGLSAWHSSSQSMEGVWVTWSPESAERSRVNPPELMSFC